MVTEVFTPWNVVPVQWGTLVVVITFLISVSVGAFFFSALAPVFGREKYKGITKYSAVASIAALVLAILALIADLGQPVRFYTLLYRFNLWSPIIWGTAWLSVFFIVSLVYVRSVYKDDAKTAKLSGSIGFLLAIAIIFYQGFELAVARGITFWNTALQPVHFLLSALLAGGALVILLAVAKKTDSEVTGSIGRMLVVAILASWFFALSNGIVMLYAGPSVMLSRIMASTLFWGVAILLGTVVPLVLLAAPQTSKNTSIQAIASVLVLVGVYTTRYVIVLTGQAVPVELV